MAAQTNGVTDTEPSETCDGDGAEACSDSSTPSATENGVEEETDGICQRPGELSLINKDLSTVPVEVVQPFGQSTCRLYLSNNQLKSAAEIDRNTFPNLQLLVLDNNLIDDDAVFSRLPKLHTLTLNKNNIRDLESLAAKLKGTIPSLRHVSLVGNPACPYSVTGLTAAAEHDHDDYQRYRYRLLYVLPHLEFIDWAPVTAAERRDASRYGQFARGVCVRHVDDGEDAGGAAADDNSYGPLPQSSADRSHPRASIGKKKYKYTGNNSEGNRFISSNDL